MLRKLILPLMAVMMLGFAVYHVVRAQQVPPKIELLVQPARSPFGRDGATGRGCHSLARNRHRDLHLTQVFFTSQRSIVRFSSVPTMTRSVM